jgi:hypothetical protein
MNDIQHNSIGCYCAECRYAECRVSFIVMLNVIMLIVEEPLIFLVINCSTTGAIFTAIHFLRNLQMGPISSSVTLN